MAERGPGSRAGLDDTVETASLLGLLGRYYERIADHGVAFAHHATFAVTGERVDVPRATP